MTVLKENSGYRLIRLDKGYTVVACSNGKVYSAMPGDILEVGGAWTAQDTPAGIKYVSSWYSKSYAYKIFNRLTIQP